MRIANIWRCGIMFVAVASVSMGQQPPAEGQNRDANLNAYAELLRKDVKKQKVSILSELMNLSPEEASKFWPVYNEYDKDLTVLYDGRVDLIKTYSDNFGSVTDQLATKLANGALDLETKRIQLKRRYFERMSQALSPKLAARFLQIENQLEKIIDLQVASNLPIVE
jgi:hypothetical protein